MKLEVKRIVVGSLDEKPIFTDQWAAVVSHNGKTLYKSVGYHYATEARMAGISWIESREKTSKA